MKPIKIVEVTRNLPELLEKLSENVKEVCDTKKTVEVTRNDDGVIINKKTGKPHFPELLEKLSENVKEVEMLLHYGYDAPSLKTQIKEQGFKVDMKLIVESELVKNQILSLEAIGILTKKQSNKAFKKLNDHIGDTITKSLFKKTAIKIKN